MAFQIPLMRNDFDIYKMNGANAKGRPIPAKQNPGRTRKTSETHSLSTSPGTHDAFTNSPSHRNLHHVSSAGSRYQFSRVNSRTSQSSLLMSPTRSQFVNNTSPPKPAKVGSQNSLNKFHNRLVDKLRKAFKSGNSSTEETTRSWKSHSVDLSSPFRRTSTDNHKKTSASSAAIVALERQFQLMEMDQASESDEQSDDDDNQQCDEKFILIWRDTNSIGSTVFRVNAFDSSTLEQQYVIGKQQNFFLHNGKTLTVVSANAIKGSCSRMCFLLIVCIKYHILYLSTRKTIAATVISSTSLRAMFNCAKKSAWPTYLYISFFIQ